MGFIGFSGLIGFIRFVGFLGIIKLRVYLNPKDDALLGNFCGSWPTMLLTFEV